MYLFLQPIPFQAWLAADCAKTFGVHKISPPSLLCALQFGPYYPHPISSAQFFQAKSLAQREFSA